MNNGQVKVSLIQQLIDSGNLVVGKNCKIEDFNIFFSTPLMPNFNNIIIGDDCQLLGHIELYCASAKVTIGNRVFIGPGSRIFCRDSVTIKDDVLISWGCTLIDTNAHSLDWRGRVNDVVDWKKDPPQKDWSVVKNGSVVIGPRSWIGFNSIITKGVTLEQGTIVGCGSVVTKSFDAFSILGGNPAQLIKKGIE